MKKVVILLLPFLLLTSCSSPSFCKTKEKLVNIQNVFLYEPYEKNSYCLKDEEKIDELIKDINKLKFKNENSGIKCEPNFIVFEKKEEIFGYNGHLYVEFSKNKDNTYEVINSEHCYARGFFSIVEKYFNSESGGSCN